MVAWEASQENEFRHARDPPLHLLLQQGEQLFVQRAAQSIRRSQPVGATFVRPVKVAVTYCV